MSYCAAFPDWSPDTTKDVIAYQRARQRGGTAKRPPVKRTSKAAGARKPMKKSMKKRVK